MSYTVVNYEVRVRDKGSWEKLDQGGHVYSSLGDCITFLNQVYNRLYGNIFESDNVFYLDIKEKQILFSWAITNSSNTYTGVTELTNENFLEKTIKIDLKKYEKEV